MTQLPRLVLFYMGEGIYHRGSEGDDQRPACQPSRIRGVPTMRVTAERRGLRPCPLCWASLPGSDPGPEDR
ncbi:MAG: hypothetical protein ACLFWM_02025 [Actinomycetota bacterium]